MHAYLIAKTAHLLFVFAFVASAFYLPRILVNLAEAGDGEPAVRGRLLLMGRRLYRFGQDVSVIVPHQFKGVGLVAAGDQRELFITLERPHDVADLAVDARRQRGLGQTRTDRRCHIGWCRADGHVAHRTVGKADPEKLAHITRAIRVCRAPWHKAARTGRAR